MKFIPMAMPSIGKHEKRLIQDCLNSTWISSAGKYIDEFETQFAKKVGSKYAISCSNGTAALHLACLAYDIGPHDEVIVPALTFISTANAVAYTGAKCIFIDSDSYTGNIDPLKIEEKITKKTRAIIPVHLYGYPCDMKSIISISKKYKIPIIEDAAEAHGALYNKKYAGSIGTIGCFSFYGNKIMTTGEGGMIVTNSKKLRDKIRLLKNHGMSTTKKYWHPIIGYNYRMTNLQAAFGLGQLNQCDHFLKVREKIKQWYNQKLKDIPEITLPPLNKTNTKSVNWLYTIRITHNPPQIRNKLIAYLKRKNIDSRPGFYPITEFSMYENKYQYPNAKMLSDEFINLPTFVTLSKKQINFICDTIRLFFKI